MFINNPEKQSQFEQDFRDGLVPQWNPNDEEAANNFATYFNNLMGQTVCEIIPTTTYKFQFINPENLR
jgi:hypothetical protein